VRALLRLFRDPQATQNVFVIVDALHDDPALRRRFPLPEPMRAFAAAPFRQDFPDLAEMASLPTGTLGRGLADHMNALGVDFSEFDRAYDYTQELDRVRRHGEETHDLWHVVTGFGTGVAGEIGLQAFMLAQTGALPSLVLLTLGHLRLYMDGLEAVDPMMDAITRGWQMGKRARPLFGIDWRPHLSRPIHEVRDELGVDAIRPGELYETVELNAA
jgi:ubiquinone biosynthesis protein Coq4